MKIIKMGEIFGIMHISALPWH